MIVLLLYGLNDLFVPHWRKDWCGRLPCDMLAGLWKKIEVFLSELIIERKKKWNFLRWLVVIDWVQICPFWWVLSFDILAPFPPPCFHFDTSLFEFLPKKIKGLQISKSDKSVGAMSSVFYATSMNRLHKVLWSRPKWIDIWSPTLLIWL